MQNALRKYVKLLADAFQLSPTCKILKALNKKEDEDSDDNAGNPPENAAPDTHEPPVLFIDSDQEQSTPSQPENAGSTGSPPKESSDAEADRKFSQVVQPTMHATQMLKTQQKCIQVDLNMLQAMVDKDAFPVNLCSKALCVPKHILWRAMKTAKD